MSPELIFSSDSSISANYNLDDIEDCKNCPSYNNCPWDNVIDCIEAREAYWFNGFFHDSVTGRVID